MIEVIVADITSLEVDVIVNAANNSLLGGGGVDGAIHKAAGSQLLAFNKGLNGCETGSAKISPGFNLKAKWIIHTVGPVWQGGQSDEAIKLARCYSTCFDIAIDRDINSIAFPAISTGVYAYPKEEAASIAINVMREFVSNINKIYVCCYSGDDKKIYDALMLKSV
jgi:O-acetyl-ADP-ribose deacetylase (regulator of RNase III)